MPSVDVLPPVTFGFPRRCQAGLPPGGSESSPDLALVVIPVGPLAPPRRAHLGDPAAAAALSWRTRALEAKVPSPWGHRPAWDRGESPFIRGGGCVARSTAGRAPTLNRHFRPMLSSREPSRFFQGSPLPGRETNAQSTGRRDATEPGRADVRARQREVRKKQTG